MVWVWVWVWVMCASGHLDAAGKRLGQQMLHGGLAKQRNGRPVLVALLVRQHHRPLLRCRHLCGRGLGLRSLYVYSDATGTRHTFVLVLVGSGRSSLNAAVVGAPLMGRSSMLTGAAAVGATSASTLGAMTVAAGSEAGGGSAGTDATWARLARAMAGSGGVCGDEQHAALQHMHTLSGRAPTTGCSVNTAGTSGACLSQQHHNTSTVRAFFATCTAAEMGWPVAVMPSDVNTLVRNSNTCCLIVFAVCMSMNTGANVMRAQQSLRASRPRS